MQNNTKDRLIIALCAQLRAERETREVLSELVAGGNFDPDVLSAILSDPVPVITQEDLKEADRIAGLTGKRSNFNFAEADLAPTMAAM